MVLNLNDEEEFEIPINARRVLDAISRIGYSEHSAIMDIVDNSVMANSKKIKILFIRKEDTTIHQSQNILELVIFDDGDGMSNDDIKHKALKLGPNLVYDEHSLSKYGMGLKSAGLSLGNRIEVLSKKGDEEYTNMWYLDKEKIQDKYKIFKGKDEDTNHLISLLNEFLETTDSNSGTLVRIKKTDKTVTSLKTIIKNLKEKLGVTYEGYLKDSLNISLVAEGINSNSGKIDIVPEDILFVEDAYEEYDPNEYDGKKPCILLKDESLELIQDHPINLKACGFPQKQMAKHSDLSIEEKESIKNYKITSKNSGFFIYRNGRLIRWGDRIAGVGGGKEKIGFRIKMDITEMHDDILEVDVSKQRLSIDDDLDHKISMLIRNAKRDSSEIYSQCADMINSYLKSLYEGSEFNERGESLAEEDLDENIQENEHKRRRKKLVKRTEQQIQDLPPEEKEDTIESETGEDIFKKVRYSSTVRSPFLYRTGFNPDYGTYVSINQNHVLYTILSGWAKDSAYRQAIEAFLWASGVAENLTFQNLAVDEDEIQKVLEKYKTLLSHHIHKWALGNQDLIDYD